MYAVISQILHFVHANTMKMFACINNYYARKNMFKSSTSLMLDLVSMDTNQSLCGDEHLLCRQI